MLFRNQYKLIKQMQQVFFVLVIYYILDIGNHLYFNILLDKLMLEV